jgi:hypothetical protein
MIKGAVGAVALIGTCICLLFLTSCNKEQVCDGVYCYDSNRICTNDTVWENRGSYQELNCEYHASADGLKEIRICKAADWTKKAETK